MIGTEAGLTRPDLEWARRHFLDHVRSFGPLPAFRCGAQPYGLLPVTSLDLWQPGPEAPRRRTRGSRGCCVALRDNVWRPAAASVRAHRQPPERHPGSGRGSRRRDAHRCGLERVSHPQRVRPAFPAASAAVRRRRAWRTAIRRRSRSCSSSASPGGRGCRGCGMPTGSGPLFSPLVQPGEVSPWRKLEPDYISALLAEPRIEQLILARPDPQAPIGDASLLQMLLRHALLREIAYAAARLQADETGADLAALLRDAELVDLVDRRAADQSLAASARADADRDRRPDHPRVSRDRRPASRRRPLPRWASSARASPT